MPALPFALNFALFFFLLERAKFFYLCVRFNVKSSLRECNEEHVYNFLL